jgi:hypothetical protein
MIPPPLSLTHTLISPSKIFFGLHLDRKSSRRYGVIECDPLVRKGLEKSVSNSFLHCFGSGISLDIFKDHIFLKVLG